MLAEAALAVTIPGWRTVHRHRALGVLLLAVGVVLPALLLVVVVISGRTWLAMTLDTRFLGRLIAVIVVASVARVVAVVEAWIAIGRPVPTDRRTAAAALIVASMFGSLTWTTVSIARARSDIGPAFDAGSDTPIYDALDPVDATTTLPTPTQPSVATVTQPAPEISTTSVVAPTTTELVTTTTVRPLPARPESGLDPLIRSEIATILLLGGDAGPGRSGLRTDSMMLLSVHLPTGRASLISVARDLRRLLFPPGTPLANAYPYGFTDIANAVYPIVSSRPSLRDAYQVDDVRPGVVAIAQGIGYSLDVTINDYVLIDMQGFIELIDALGGVTVTLTSTIPMPGNVPGAPVQYPDTIGPGTLHLDGSTALGFVRSRKGDSDYRRAARQRQLLAALATQISLADVIGSFGSVTSAIGGTLRTSLSPDELSGLLALIGGETAIVESMGLVPPLVRPSNPDYGAAARIVGAVHTALATGVASGY